MIFHNHVKIRDPHKEKASANGLLRAKEAAWILPGIRTKQAAWMILQRDLPSYHKPHECYNFNLGHTQAQSHQVDCRAVQWPCLKSWNGTEND